jgi:hypothetical protein
VQRRVVDLVVGTLQNAVAASAAIPAGLLIGERLPPIGQGFILDAAP